MTRESWIRTPLKPTLMDTNDMLRVYQVIIHEYSSWNTHQKELKGTLIMKPSYYFFSHLL